MQFKNHNRAKMFREGNLDERSMINSNITGKCLT